MRADGMEKEMMLACGEGKQKEDDQERDGWRKYATMRMNLPELERGDKRSERMEKADYDSR